MQYPKKHIADELASHGRFLDTRLIHVNEAELQGIASLVPGGKLTTNPVTGQPEAFLPFLIPLLASWGGGAAAGAMGAGAIGSAIAAGAASGLATTAITGDAKRGLVSGIMGAGLGAGLAAAGGNAAAAAASAKAAGTGVTGANIVASTDSILPGIAQTTAGELEAARLLAANQSAMGAGAFSMPGAIPATPAATGISPSNFSGAGFMENLKAPFGEGSQLGTELMKARTMLPLAIGSGQMTEWDAQDQRDAFAKEKMEEGEKKRREIWEQLQGSYRAAQPGAAMGVNPYRGQMSYNAPPPVGYGGGGLLKKSMMLPFKIEPIAIGAKALMKKTTPKYYEKLWGKKDDDDENGEDTSIDLYGGIDPVTVQQNLRGQYSVGPPQGFRAGFSPEFNYFQNDRDNIQSPPITGPRDWTQLYAGYPSSQIRQMPYFESVIPPKGMAGGGMLKKAAKFIMNPPLLKGLPVGIGSKFLYNKFFDDKDKEEQERLAAELQNPYFESQPIGMAQGGGVTVSMPSGSAEIAPGGIANIDNQFTNPQQPGPQQPDPQDLEMVAMALSGQAGEQSGQIIEMFIQKYGVQMFRQVRNMILKAGAPNAQTEGLVQGPGGGMDDQVMGMIGGNEPVAVSPGEYILPADVVSGLGDGSSDAGAAELDQMAQNVRMARGGTVQQPPPTDARRLLPA